MKDGVRARYTLEFKQEAVRLVRGGETLASAARGAVADVVGIARRRFSGGVEGSCSGGEVNRLMDWLGEGLPAIDLAHGDLA